MSNLKIPKARQLPSGSWRCEVSANGKRVSFVKDSKEESEKAALLFKLTHSDSPSDLDEVAEIITVKEAISAYIEDRKNVLSPATIRGYKNIQKHRFQSVMDDPLTRKQDWQKIINIEAKTLSAKTIKNAWGLLRAVLEENEVKYGKVRLPKVVREEHLFLQPEQIKTFVQAINGDIHELAYLLCLHGLRRSEMLAVEKKNIVKGMIQVRGAKVHDDNGKLVYKETNKNDSSRRNVPILLDRLQELVDAAPDGYLIKKTPSAMFEHLGYVCRLNNLPEIGFHGLRHSFVSLCYHLNMREAQVMEFGGYSDISVMRKIYTHLADSDRSKAISDLRNFFQ